MYQIIVTVIHGSFSFFLKEDQTFEAVVRTAEGIYFGGIGISNVTIKKEVKVVYNCAKGGSPKK